MAPSDYIVKPVFKALQVLSFLGQERRELSLKEVAHGVGFPQTTTYKYLCTLQATGFVARDPSTDLYRLGVRLWELGHLVNGDLQIRKVALPLMQSLRDRFNETVNLGVLDGTEVVYVEMVESRLSLRMQAQLGGRDPVYSTSLGKAMLAFLPEEAWNNHLPKRLTARTPHTITALSALQQDLRETRERGFSIDRAENEEGARCIGAPIFDSYGTPVAAISLSAPAMRLDDTLTFEAAKVVKQTAQAISERMAVEL
jgi:IclR family transcriptional regulator, KDG regulon repressor